MSLLFDQNLSSRLPARLAGIYPGSQSVFSVGLLDAKDIVIWRYAAAHGFTIVTKDTDFVHLSQVHAAPPKVIRIRKRNCTTREIVQLLTSHFANVQSFLQDPSTDLLTLQ